MWKQVLSRSVPIIFLMLMWACNNDRLRIDIEGDPVELEWLRMDRAVFDTPAAEIPQKCLDLQARSDGFFKVYMEDILRLAPIGSPELPGRLIGFAKDPDWRQAQKHVEEELGDMENEKQQLQLAFSRLKTVYPEAAIPQVVLFNSGFNFGIAPMDSVLGIGVEWFIGSDKEVIAYLAPENFPNYLKERMIPEMLVPSAIKGWLLAHHSRDVAGEDLLTHLVDRGKVMVLLDALLPETPEHLQMAFKEEQLAWCEEQEFNMWRELIDKEMLFSKKADDIGRFMNDGPFTNGFPRESPGHVGEWIGKQMVLDFWERNDQLSLREVMEVEDPNRILKFYKP